MSFLRNNGLTIILLAASVATIMSMSITGWLVFSQQAMAHETAAISFFHYVLSGHFLSALFENWESEFLQMSAYVFLTAYFYQRGSAESKDPDAPDQQDEPPADAGLFVRLTRTLYAYSLGLALAALFVAAFTLHLVFSAQAAAEDAARHGEAAPSIGGHIAEAQFWFESFQNWQSEFLSTMVLVVLSIILRYRGSPQSKPVSAPHSQTGTSD